MKKNIYRIFVILIIIICSAKGKVYGYDYSGWTLYTCDLTAGDGDWEKRIKPELKDLFSKDIDNWVNPMKIKTTAKVVSIKEQKNTVMDPITGGTDEVSTKWYTVQIGKGEKQAKCLFGDVRDKFGYTGSEKSLKEGTSWTVYISANTGIKPKEDEDYKITVNELWSSDPGDEPFKNQETINFELKQREKNYKDRIKNLEKGLENLNEIKNWITDGVSKFMENFKKDKGKTILGLFLDLIRVIPDICQMIADLFQITGDKPLHDKRVTYSMDYIQENNEKNKYVNAQYGKEGKIDVTLGENDEEYTSETEIPVIPVDTYNMAIGDIPIFDINFLTVNESLHESNDIWTMFRNILTAIIHIMMYIVAAILITSLIWHAIHIVIGSIDSPLDRLKHVNGIKNFATGVVMLIGAIFIEAICIYASQMFLSKIDLGITNNELPIRVYVKFAEDDESEHSGYSFSTNLTGYVRYMTEIENVELVSTKALYTGIYFIFGIMNLVAAIFMFVRMIAMMFLSAIGPLIVAFYVFKTEDSTPWRYGKWAKLYAKWSLIQVFFALVYKLILENKEIIFK